MKSKNRIKYIKNKLVITSKKPPVLVKVLLSIIISISFLLPISATALYFINGGTPHIGILFMFLLFWAIGYFLLRVFLWNNFGKEIVKFNNDGIEYIADYKYFTDSKMKIKNDLVKFEFIQSFDCENNGRILIQSENEKIETVLEIERNDYEQIIKEIEKEI